MKTRLLLTLSFVLAVLTIYPQTAEDGLRYSRTSPLGSARFMAMSGAYGAIGADFSALSLNPAGIAVFRSSEFTITPLITYNETETRYFGDLNDDNKYHLGLANFGLVFTSDLDKGKESGWKNLQFGIGYTRLNNFNNRVFIQGFNNNSSLMTSYVHAADFNAPENLDNFTTGMAYDTWLIWPMDTIDFIYDADAYLGKVMQEELISTSGSMNEWSFTLGSNYNDVLYFGASIGIPVIRFNYESNYREDDINNQHPYFNHLTRRDILETSGTGVNFKLGAIARVSEWLRLGAAYHTPTFYWNMDDKYRSRMTSELVFDNQAETRSADSPRGRFEYEMTTPMKAIGSATFLFQKSGLLSIEYEYTDHSKTKYNSSTYKFRSENRDIRDSYKTAHNLRVGTEWRLKDIYFRGGYALFGSPYESGINDGKGNQFSLGLGFRQQDYYIDFAYVNSTFKEDRYMYSVPDSFEGHTFTTPIANQEFSRQLFMLTLGWRF
jgi:hypothetical protein